MPELPENFMFSERLEKLHASMDSSRVVSVCAPAGYGKQPSPLIFTGGIARLPEYAGTVWTQRIGTFRRLSPISRNRYFPQMILASSNPEGCLRNMPIWNPSPNRPLP